MICCTTHPWSVSLAGATGVAGAVGVAARGGAVTVTVGPGSPGADTVTSCVAVGAAAGVFELAPAAAMPAPTRNATTPTTIVAQRGVIRRLFPTGGASAADGSATGGITCVGWSG